MAKRIFSNNNFTGMDNLYRIMSTDLLCDFIENANSKIIRETRISGKILSIFDKMMILLAFTLSQLCAIECNNFSDNNVWRDVHACNTTITVF